MSNQPPSPSHAHLHANGGVPGVLCAWVCLPDIGTTDTMVMWALGLLGFVLRATQLWLI